MREKLYKYSNFFKIFPLKTLIGLTGKKAIFPFYHLISDKEVVHIKHLYKIRSIKEFNRDLDFFLKEFELLDPTELIASNNVSVMKKKPCFLLTFDDGLSQFYDIVAPILMQKGIPAICFINTGFIDNKDLHYKFKISVLLEQLTKKSLLKSQKAFIKSIASELSIQFDEEYRFLLKIKYSERYCLDKIASILGIDFQEYLEKNKPFMDTEQIKYLIRQGFLFGSHSIDHPLYSELSQNQQITQTAQSISELTTLFELDYKLFAFPFTDLGVSNTFFNAIYAEAQKIVDLSFGTQGLKTDSCKKNIQRIPMEINNYSAEEVIYGEYLSYLVRIAIDKSTIRRT